MRLYIVNQVPRKSFFNSENIVVRIGRFLQVFGVVFIILCNPVSLAEGLDFSAKDFIESVGYTAQAILRSDAIDDDQKIKSIQRMLQNSVDLESAGQRVLGPSWKAATKEQRSEYNKLFADYALRIYPRALLKHQSQEFIVTGSKKSTGNDTLVFSRIEGAKGQSLHWSWRVHDENGKYKIMDLLADGISMTSTLREEFNSNVFRHGLDGLLEKFRSIE